MFLTAFTHMYTPRLALSASQEEKADVYRLIRLDILVARET